MGRGNPKRGGYAVDHNAAVYRCPLLVLGKRSDKRRGNRFFQYLRLGVGRDSGIGRRNFRSPAVELPRALGRQLMRASSSDNPIFQGFPKSANVHGGYRSATTDTFSMVMMMLIVLHVGLKLNPKVRLNALDFQEPSHQFQKLLRMAAF